MTLLAAAGPPSGTWLTGSKVVTVWPSTSMA